MSRIRLTISFVAALQFWGCSTVHKTEPVRKLAVSDPFNKPAPGTLFSSYNEMNISISAPLTTLFKDKKLGRQRFKESAQMGTLTVGKDKYPIRVQMKGYSSASMCPFPKLEITILDGHHKNTIFAEARTFDLNTHCADKDYQMDSAFKASFYNHREALIYRVLDILEIPTFKSRPAMAQYTDEDSNTEMGPFQAFFLEDTSSFKKRLEAREIKGVNDPEKDSKLKENPKKEDDYIFTNVQESKKIDPEDAAQIALFNEMIGNYDWFIKADPEHMRSPKDFKNLWNIKIFEMKNGNWIIFPQDFSLAETVTGIRKPTYYQRVFDLVSTSSKNKIKKKFMDKKDEILQLTENLDLDGKKYFTDALTKFFSEIDK